MTVETSAPTRADNAGLRGSAAALVTSSSDVAAPPREGHLALFDGLRAYLASWVLVCHAMWLSGYDADELSGVWAVVARGSHAVDVFVMLSGFVIFKLLDTRRESYGAFVFRRFLRLYPVFILLFMLAIPTARMAADDLVLASRYYSEAHTAEVAAQFSAWFAHIEWHSFLHMFMLHGIVPRTLLLEAPGAFLEPAWSISLEWQFYLVAPAAYALATSKRGWHRIAVSAGALIAFALAASGLLPKVDFGAALPFHAEYFYLGALSYFLYKQTLRAPLSNTPALVAIVTSLFVFQLGHRYSTLIPICLWTVVLGLLFERGNNRWVAILTKPLLLPAAQCVGRISYSLYLCHMLLLYIVQHFLLRAAPDLSRATHCLWLTLFTFAAAVPVSAFLFRHVEEPAMRFGKSLDRHVALQPAE
jgi:peptidoglycan/LPS O-acetylase OafA/YrhL